MFQASALQLDTSNDTVGSRADVGPSVFAVVHREQPCPMERQKMYRLNQIYLDENSHKQLIADAVRRRLYPNTGVQPKALAAAIGVSDQTILNIRNGNVDPGSFTLFKLIGIFGPVFLQEIFGPRAALMWRQYEQCVSSQQRALEAERAAMKMVGGE